MMSQIWMCNWFKFYYPQQTGKLGGHRDFLSPGKDPLLLFTRIMVSKGTWHKTSTQNLRVFSGFWVLITLTSTLNPICPVLRYPCGKQFFSTEYPSNEIYFPDKKPYSGDFQYKKSHFGKKWPKIDQICEKKRGFYHCKHSFSPEWSISINKIPL